MSLYVDLYVNDRKIGEVHIRNTSAELPEESEYEWSYYDPELSKNAIQELGPRFEGFIRHVRSRGAVELASRVLARIAEAQNAV